MEESEFEKYFVYTLRVELSNGKVLVYPIDSENKEYLFNKLSTNSDGYNESNQLRFLWFETSLARMAIINTSAVISITFLVDPAVHMINHTAYPDNFNVVEKDTFIEEKETKEGETRLYVLEEEYLPQAIIYHKGQAPDDHYNKNPLLYSQLSPGCLGLFNLELDGILPFRQFINLTDNDDEETFIPLEQIIVMEFYSNLIYEAGQEE
jgi:hypothetical protein